MTFIRLNALAGLVLALTLPLMGLGAENDVPMQEGGSWDDIKYDFFEDAELLDGSAYFDVELPVRAEDAATVPIRIVSKDGAPEINNLKVIIDENPSPLAADFNFTEAMNPIDFETRIRVNQYSNVRVIAEIDGKLYQNGHYVKASGGCSAPASKDPAEAKAEMGQMRYRLFDPSDNEAQQSQAVREAQLMIRHPNYSGLQRDQITQLFVPALFIYELDVTQGDENLFTMEGGISISENPTFRFTYQDNGSTDIRIKAVDTDGNAFEEDFEKSALSG